METGNRAYMALRRLGKRCWMLQYDDGGTVFGEKMPWIIQSAYSIFDYYLNGTLLQVDDCRVPARLKDRNGV